MNTHITLNEGKLQATDGKVFIDFRPGDYRHFVSNNQGYSLSYEVSPGRLSAIAFEIKESEIYPCPNGFEIKIEAKRERVGASNRLVQYAKLVPIKGTGDRPAEKRT